MRTLSISVLAATLAIVCVSGVAAAPPVDKPVKHCHSVPNCVTKVRTCPPPQVAQPGGPPPVRRGNQPACTPGPYQVCSGNKVVCEND